MARSVFRGQKGSRIRGNGRRGVGVRQAAHKGAAESLVAAGREAQTEDEQKKTLHFPLLLMMTSSCAEPTPSTREMVSKMPSTIMALSATR